ncbi:hypothetical protein pEaSNUABM37_00250 [Erwinia phage pEa_SNUABM_37]|nr:hypothetical protein pEaSNUABM37_00250 [Erwinia phage pEa_SNUABM_37]QXO10718.1 hypothetical protein pEaSNUABM48_00250 [Erwinia phage pEa_SNUABM_48]
MGYELLVKGAVVDFVVYAPEILTSGFTNAKINGVIDMETAQALGLDVQAMHNNLYPLIKPQGYADDPSSYGYVRVTKENGVTTTLGIPWIVESSIAVKMRNRITVDIPDVGTNDIALVKAALESNGYPNAVVKLVD